MITKCDNTVIYGRGLNSLRMRFTLMALVLGYASGLPDLAYLVQR